MSTTLKLGWTSPLSGAFGDHPALGPVFELNDGVTFALATPDGLDLHPPARTVVTAGNVRTRGERATRATYRHNREVIARLILGPMASFADLAANVHSLVAWLNAPPAVPFTIQYQPNGATLPVYLDVVACAHTIPEDEGQWLRLQFEPVEIVFICRPGLRGDRITLQNLVVNPGFEAPSGPGVVVFSDTFANVSAYTVQAGGSPTTGPANTYIDVVMGNGGAGLLRYYRLDEASGTNAQDISGLAATGTTHGSPTLGVAGLVSGDTDTCMTFAAGSSQYVDCPVAGLPTGNAAMTLGPIGFKFAANPASQQELLAYGATGAHNYLQLFLDSTGHVNADVGTGVFVTSGVLATGVAHQAAATWDGTTLTLYVDGSSVGTMTPGAQTIPTSSTFLRIGASVVAAPTQFYSGQLDEASVYNAVLSSGQISAIWTAFHSGASGTLASAVNFPAATRVSFGSTALASVNTWQVRFRWVTGGVYSFYLHFVDTSNYIRVQVAAGGLNFFIVQRIAGVDHTLASATIVPVHEAWYWLRVTQFPTVAGDPACVQAVLSYDDAGAVGAQVAALGPVGTFDAVTALAGGSQLMASGAALVVGGTFGHSVSLFGPGGWQFATSGSVPAIGVWDGSVPERGTLSTGAANMYSGGPVTSFGAGRIDTPASGTVDARWRLYSGGTPAGSWALPVASAGNVLAVAAWVKSSGLGVNAQLQAIVSEYDASGSFLRSGTVATLTGNQAAWVNLSGTYTTGASCAYVDLALRVVDSNAGASANASVWFDNAQVWNQTVTGSASMPWCQLRMPQSPCEIVVSGLLGDLPAPALLQWGTYLTSWPAGSSLSFAVGRRNAVSPSMRLVAPPVGFYGTALSPTSIGVLDSGSYGGFCIQVTMTGAGWNPRCLSVTAADDAGVYHLFDRFLSQQIVGNLPNVQTRVSVQQRSQPWYGDYVGNTDQVGSYFGPFTAPLTQSGVWTVVDSGQAPIPFAPSGALTDPSQLVYTPRGQWQDLTGGGAIAQAGWQMLLPIDGSLLVGMLNNPSNAPFAVTNEYLWCYLDGLLVNRAGASDGPSWLYSLEGAASPNPARGGGNFGTQNTGTINVNCGADPYLVLDPTLQVTGQSAGVNQMAAYVADQAGAVLPFFGEIAYVPLYLYSR